MSPVRCCGPPTTTVVVSSRELQGCELPSRVNERFGATRQATPSALKRLAETPALLLEREPPPQREAFLCRLNHGLGLFRARTHLKHIVSAHRFLFSLLPFDRTCPQSRATCIASPALVRRLY